MTDARDALNRRHFLERMTALAAAAAVAPETLRAAVPAPDGAPGGGRPIVPADLPVPGRVEIQSASFDELTVVEAAQLVRDRDLSPAELVVAHLDRIERWDGVYRAFNTVLAERALETARIRGSAAARGPLHGVPIALKDNFFTAGVPTTANSHLFADFVPAFDATAWTRLREAGAILLGKTQMGPLATTAATTPDGERTTVNAWSPFDPGVSPGGSSSGSATAVAARMATCATGTQTGGSITGPSASQGLTGIKPTMGRVSLHGILPLTYTRDHVGPLARDARDAALMLRVMAGPDRADPRSRGLPPVPNYLAATDPRPGRGELEPGLRIGVWPGYLDEPAPPAGGDRGAEPGEDEDRQRQAREQDDEARARRAAARERARAAFGRRRQEAAARREMLGTLEDLGATIVEIEVPERWETLTSSAFNNVRLPERSEIFLEHLRGDVRDFGVSLSPWINGLLLPAAEYVRGQRAKLLLLRSILDDILSRCDVVVQTRPFPFDMVGLPLITFPIGFETDSTAGPRPIGALFGGAPYGEDRLLALAAAYQRATDWHRRRPADPDAFEAEPSGGPKLRIDALDVMDLCQ